MTNYWHSIETRLHEESLLHYPTNHVRLILQAYLNGVLNQYDSDFREFFNQGFLLTCVGEYLNERGNEVGIQRNTDESDAEYKQRLFNNISTNLSVNFIKKMGVILYTKESLEENIREKMTSNNPYLSRKYACIPKNSMSKKFIENEVIIKNIIILYVKGW